MKIIQLFNRRYIDILYDGLCKIDLMGNIIYFNSKFINLLGYDKKELKNTNLLQIVDNDTKLKIKHFISISDKIQPLKKKILGGIKKKK